MKVLSKIICTILVFVIAVAQLPITTLAKNENVPTFKAEQTDVKSQDGRWIYDIALDKNEEPRVWITRFNPSKAENEFIIPAMIDGMRVQSVDIPLTIDRKNITKVIFEENIERIGGNFFSIMNNVEFVLPSSLLMIDKESFRNSKNITIHFPERLCSIGSLAFQNTTFSGDTELVLPDSLEYIANGAFENTNITSVKIGPKTNFCASSFSQTIGVYNDSSVSYPCTPFPNCSSLASLEIDENNPYFVTKNGMVYSADEKELVFINGEIQNLMLPEGVEYICDGILKNRTYDTVVIPSTLQNYFSVSFSGSTIGNLSFDEDCSYERVYTNTFKDCKIDEVTIPKSIQFIEFNAFKQCGIKHLYFEEGSALTNIGEFAFYGNDFETLDLTNCQLLSKVDENVFCGNRLLLTVDMTGIPLEKIGQSMFSGCYQLKQCILSEYTKIIDLYAFSDDRELTDIDLSNIANCDSTAFWQCKKFNPSNYILSSGTTEDGFVYNEFENHISLTGYTGDSRALVIPDTINDKPVTDIAWKGNDILRSGYSGKKITSLTLPSHLEYIGSYAFQHKDVGAVNDFPVSLRFIGEYAFCGGRFTDVKLNEGLSYVLSEAFQGCPFESLDIPDSVFFYAGGFGSATRFSLGKNVRNIRQILGVTTIESPQMHISISLENPYYCFENGVLYNKEKTEIYRFYTNINAEEVAETYQIPATVKKIDAQAFFKAVGFKNVIIPASVTSIGKEAFSWSSVESVHFADGFKAETLDRTFSNCKKLTRATFGKKVGVKNLIATFAATKLQNLDIPKSVENLTGTYQMTNLSFVKELSLPKGLKVLGPWVFGYSYLSIKELTIPDGVTTIGYLAFGYSKKLKTIHFNHVTFLAEYAFQGCESLKNVDLTGIKYVPDSIGGTFSGCKNLKKITYNRTDRTNAIEDEASKGNMEIDTVVVGNGISEIKHMAFADCLHLETAVISESVETIADDAFDNCKNLTIVCTENSPAMLFAQRNHIQVLPFKISPIPDQVFTGKAIKPQLKVTVGDTVLAADMDYTVSYSNNIKPGTARALVAGLDDYSIYASTVKFNIIHQHNYTVKIVKPTYASQGYTLYTCFCGHSYKNNVKAKLTVPAMSVKKLKKGKKRITVSFKKAKGVSGYKIQYSPNKNFKHSKIISVSATKSSATLKKLKAKKKYYVRICAYKKVGNKIYYSHWSKAKSIKTK